MQKIIHNVALLATLAALTAGLWQGWGTWLTVKHMIISYLAFYSGGLVLWVVFRFVAPGDQAPARGTNRGPARK